MQVAAENLLLCGGGSAAAGLGPRLLQEVRLQMPPPLTPSLLHSPEYMPPATQQLSVWMGGAILSKVGLPLCLGDKFGMQAILVVLVGCGDLPLPLL